MNDFRKEPIQTSNPRASYLAYKAEIDAAIHAVLDQPGYILGPVVERFEERFAHCVGVGHGVGVNSGTDALHLALRGLGIGRGDEVITVSHTSVATVAAIEMSGAAPVLVDVELPWLTIDPRAAASAVGPRTKAVIVVHLYGQPCDLTRLRALCQRHGLVLIEDCAQSHGAAWSGQPAGSFGTAACFSFYPTKNLGTVGMVAWSSQMTRLWLAGSPCCGSMDGRPAATASCRAGTVVSAPCRPRSSRSSFVICQRSSLRGDRWPNATARPWSICRYDSRGIESIRGTPITCTSCGARTSRNATRCDDTSLPDAWLPASTTQCLSIFNPRITVESMLEP